MGTGQLSAEYDWLAIFVNYSSWKDLWKDFGYNDAMVIESLEEAYLCVVVIGYGDLGFFFLTFF